jgi:ricin-type beta-trefoil lectin protein
MLAVELAHMLGDAFGTDRPSGKAWSPADSAFLVGGAMPAEPGAPEPVVEDPGGNTTPVPGTLTPTGGPAPPRTTAGSGSAASARPTGTPVSPVTTRHLATARPVSPPVVPDLVVTDAGATTARLAWVAAPPGSRHAVGVDGRPVGTVGVTAVRLVGLRPDTIYTVTVSTTTPDGTSRTRHTTVHTGPDIAPVMQTWLSLTNSLTGGAPEVAAARQAPGTGVVSARRTDGNDQRWLLRAVGTGTYQLVVRSSGECLAGAASRVGAPLVQQPCRAAATTQQWRLATTPFGFRLAAVHGGLVVGIGTARLGGQPLLVLQAPNGCRYQSWTAS